MGVTSNYEDPSEFLLLLVENYSMTTSNMLSRAGESLKLDISYEICISSLRWLLIGCCEEGVYALSFVSDLLLLS